MTMRTMMMMRMKMMVIKTVVTISQAFIGYYRSILFCTDRIGRINYGF